MSAGRGITFLFTDMEASTRYWETAPEAMRMAMERHDALLTELITAHGGRVILERGEGDSFFAVFERPAAAVAAACSAQRALNAECWPGDIPVRVRMAVHTGEADAHYRGPDVNRCARLRAIAWGGQIVVSAEVEACTRGELPAKATLVDLGRHRLRDLTRPEQVFQLTHPDLATGFPPLRSLGAFRHYLPVQLTSFIGREREISELKPLILDHPLVTMLGTGGCGKTRLALQVAADLLDTFPDGSWFVDLAPLSDPGHVTLAVAQALRVSEAPGRDLLDEVTDRLSAERLLLVLDNCEHVIQSAAETADVLLRAAPGLRVLATSRETLGVPGEVAWRVPSLELPDPDRASPEVLLGAEAVRLFSDRASAARPGFVLDAAQATVAARICARLDGIPLAIELAAARTRMLSPEDILDRLNDRFRLLVGGSRTALGRQQTLRAAVEWSHQLLDPDEQACFRRLAPFAGSFDLAAAERVAAEGPVDGANVVDLLGRLADKSLIASDITDDGRVLYRLLETLRQYGREQLEAAGEAVDAGDRHLAHFLDLAEQGWLQRVEGEAEWLARLEEAHPNLRAALDWARARHPDDHLRLSGALGWFWHLHAHYLEGRGHLTASLAGSPHPGPLRARALWGAGTLAGWQGDEEAARRLIEDSRTMAEAAGDKEGVAMCLDSLGWTAFWNGFDEEALAHFTECLRLRSEGENPRLVLLAKVGVCQALVGMYRTAEAEPLAREILAAGLEAGDPRNTHFGYHFLADCALIARDGDAAEVLYRDSLAATLAYGDLSEAVWEVEGVAMSAGARGRGRRALLLGGAMEARKKELGTDALFMNFWNELALENLGKARTQLGPDAAAATWTEGRAMGWDTAVAYALDLTRD